MKPFRRRASGILAHGAQTASLLLFWFLLFSTAWPLAEMLLPADFFLHMDPLAAVLAPLAGREWGAILAPGIAILALSFAAGRFFCGWLCPFGATLDLARRLLRARDPDASKKVKDTFDDGLERRGRNVKFFALAIMLGAAVLGVNDFYWGSPIPLITRFYALLAHPLLLFLSNLGLTLGQPIFAVLDMQALRYLDVPARRFDSLYFLLAFFGLLFWLERRYPRFWCRCLCPAGALLGLASQRPLLRRRVTGCAQCSRCARLCPMGAINPQTMQTRHGECLVCRTCADACPARAITFSPWGLASRYVMENASVKSESAAKLAIPDAPEFKVSHLPPLPSRRAFLGSAGLGLLLAGVQRSGAHSLLNADNRQVSPACIRPPGAIPEPAFLALCLRCGECMKGCPSNALQPAWLAAGPEGLFSPVLTPRLGPCLPDCNACGRVCPTQAIKALPLEEKRWARVGTAVVLQNTCLAWAQGRACVVCQEVCPYGAVKLQKMEGFAVPAPVVDNNRCYGCGYCERHCPVLVSAIVVEPLNALRLTSVSYKQTAQAAGMDYAPSDSHGGKRPDAGHAQDLPEGSLPPGFSE
ncbi:MAG: 4Fe-4S dicluster domain-containing protein [Desulfovibrio sp.]|jgi:MauM/NapG family ferredoxin protein|nr:4Fe-4S dicluster domain-containing protein [Desulfovibrio sp.]